MAKRGPKGPHSGNFKPGQSGNPGGRPKAPKESLDIKALAKSFSKEAIEALRLALQMPRERVAAATALLDRGWGRPQQTLNVRRIADITDLDDEELLALTQHGQRVEDQDGSTRH